MDLSRTAVLRAAGPAGVGNTNSGLGGEVRSEGGKWQASPRNESFVCRQKLPRAANQQRAGTLISAGVSTDEWRERRVRKEGKKRGTFRHGGGEGTHFGELEGKVEIGGKLVLDVAYMKPRENTHSPGKGGKDCRQKARARVAPPPAPFPTFPRVTV